MRTGCKSWQQLGLVAATTMALVGVAVGQVPRQQPRQQQGEPHKANRDAPPPLVGVPAKKARPDAADPLVRAGVPKKLGNTPIHFTFRLNSYDGTPLAASYYPVKTGSSAPVVVLIHEPGRSRKDFEDGVLELKGQGFAEHLQSLGFAVLTFDLRGQGQNMRRVITVDDRPLFLQDLQAVYFFLVDRHNRGDLNITKLGIVALGSSSNMVAAWAVQPGAAITTEGRLSDLSALVFMSPKPEGFGSSFGNLIGMITPRVPVFLAAGERDNTSRDAVQSIRARVERTRLNKVEIFPSSLQGYKLLRLEPKAAQAVIRFLETTLKNRAVEWEPRYNLAPVAYGDIHVVSRAATPAQKAEERKAALPRPAQPAPKAAPPAQPVIPPQPQPAKPE